MSAQIPTFPHDCDGALWAETDRKLTMGYIGADGARVPGFLEQMALMSAEHAKDRELRQRVDSHLIRAILVIGFLRFAGIDHFTDLLKLFGFHP